MTPHRIRIESVYSRLEKLNISTMIDNKSRYAKRFDFSDRDFRVCDERVMLFISKSKLGDNVSPSANVAALDCPDANDIM